jgi:CRP-like cAMP-binding protein
MGETERTHTQIPVRRRDHDRVRRGEVVFRRVAGALFAESPTASDARQGVIGDCYLLSAFSALARSCPASLKALLTHDGGELFTARFYRRAEGELIEERVTVDSAVPVYAADGEPIYARSGRLGEIWPIIAEKAYAAWKGGYDVAGEGGMVELTLEELTGEPTRMLFVAETKPEQLWRLLWRATREGWPTAVCTYGRRERPEIDALGFHPNHILVFLGVHTWMGRRIVWLRDPFDTPACGTMVKPDPNGVYTIAWEDFLRYFAEVELNSSAACAVALPPFPSQTIRETIDRSYVFEALGRRQRQQWARDFTRVRVKPGEVIAAAGAPADYFYVVQHGTAAVEIPSKGRSERVAVAHAGDQFGEIHAMEQRSYDASLRATTAMSLYRMPAAKLRRWVGRHPELAVRLRRRFELRLTMLEWRSHQITTVNADSLLRAGQEARYRKGQVIYRPGDIADAVFLVVEGGVKIGRARLSGGQVFGETEVLKRTLRTTTAVAGANTTVLRLDLGSAAEVMEQFDIVQRQLAAIADRRERQRLQLPRHR